VVWAGCGRLDFEPGDGGSGASDGAVTDAAWSSDGGVADGSEPDAGTVPSWGPAVAVPALSSDADDDDPTLTADMLELYFDSNRSGGPGRGDVWVSRRESPEEPWGPPELVEELSSEWSETTPEVSLDGLTMWLASDRPGGEGDYDVWVSTRASREEPWSVPEHVPSLSSEDDERSPTPFAGGLEMVLMIQRGTFGAEFRLYSTARAGRFEPWSAPTRIEELASRDEELCPHPVGSTWLFFASDRWGDFDLYASERAGPDQPWGDPVRLPSVSSPAMDNDPWVAPDLSCIYFASERDGRRQQIYRACR
jgi:hypothetical protein